MSNVKCPADAKALAGKQMSNVRGFTLIEILVVLGIVMVVVGLLGQIFSTVTNLQRQILTRQKMIDEVRNAIDTLVDDMRGGQIQYSAYVNTPTIALPKLLISPPDVLRLYGKDGISLVVSRSTNRGACGAAEEIRCLLLQRGSDAAIPLTGPTVHVKSLSFMIDPLVDPFVLNAGAYLANAQPRVTMIVTLDAADPRFRDRFPITVQTTIGTRAILR
ncbi:prepilin-type N-terminal cleavage/methylation domain-containing protein [Candidatus Uhrbacteria bacterium]|nr:prepilin-type N-terminal cleavage/methylation domain-containing protein [Candidatus Uhrbacteria bacterium]